MEEKIIKNKDGEILKTKEGVELKEYKLEAGDEFIPTYNRVLERKNNAIVRGKEQVITNYSVKAKARNKNKELINDGEEIFITLTPTQANAINKLKDSGIEINQTLFRAYEYDHEEYGKQIGVGTAKDFKKPKTFDDFDNSEEDKSFTSS